jgi:hypothetical protein
MFIFGKGVKPGVIGDAFLTNASGTNLAMQYDYRVVYANILRDWMLVDDDRLNKVFPDGNFEEDSTKGLMTTGTSDGTVFEELPLAQQVILGTEGFIGDRFSLEDCFPNPAKEKTTIHFKVNSAYHVTVDLFNNSGKKLKTMVDGVYSPGEHKIEVNLEGLPAGNYVYQLRTGFYKDAKKLVILR